MRFGWFPIWSWFVLGFPWGGLICCGFGFVCFACFTAGMLVLVGLCDLRFDFWFDDLVVCLGLVLC